MSNEINNVVENGINAANTIAESFKTLGELIQEKLAASGAQEASAFEVTINNGVTHMVVSDADGVLNTRIAPTDEVQIRKVNSATAGC